MKKILSIILALLMIASLSTAVFASETEVAYDSSWVITASSEHSADVGILKAFDGDSSTYWHTRYYFDNGEAKGDNVPPHMITIEFPSEKTISGWKYTPRIDNGTGTAQEYNIYVSTDGTKYEKIYKGSFSYQPGAGVVRNPESASWGNVKMKAIKIEITKTLGGFGSAAEINLYTGGSGKPNASGTLNEASSSTEASASSSSNAQKEYGTVVKYESSWNVTASSEHSTDLGILKAFDGDNSTYWHTKFYFDNGEAKGDNVPPHVITVVFPSEKEISGWKYTPRTDNGAGTALAYNIYASSDGTEYKKIYKDSFDYQPGAGIVRNPESASWGNVKMKAIKIEITKTLSGYGSAAEINFYTGGSGETNASGTYDENSKVELFSERTASDGTPLLDKTGWKAEVNSQKASNPVELILDDNVNTYWHSDYAFENGQPVSLVKPPYHLKVTLPKETAISGIVLTPRTDNTAGRITGADIYVSDTDDGDYFLLKQGLTFSKDSTTPQEIEFTANIKVKRVWIEITSGYNDYGTLAELDLMDAKDDIDTVKYEDYAAHEYENELCKIDNENFMVKYDGNNWGSNVPQNLFDGKIGTFWQTDGISTSDWPVILTVDLKSVYGVKEIRYTPRQTEDHHGSWLNVTISGSIDGENWQVLKESIDIEENLLTKKITFSETDVRYIEFQINKAVGGRVSGAELELYQSHAAKDAYEAKNSAKFILKIGSNVIETIKGGVTKNTEIDVAPYIVNGSTMIPLRGLMEEMGATVTWNGEDETVYIEDGVNKLKLQIWNYNVDSYDTAYGDLIYSLLNPPIIKDSRTFIPIRFVSEQLGYKVSWDGETQTVTIEK